MSKRERIHSFQVLMMIKNLISSSFLVFFTQREREREREREEEKRLFSTHNLTSPQNLERRNFTTKHEKNVKNDRNLRSHHKCMLASTSSVYFFEHCRAVSRRISVSHGHRSRYGRQLFQRGYETDHEIIATRTDSTVCVFLPVILVSLILNVDSS